MEIQKFSNEEPVRSAEQMAELIEAAAAMPTEQEEQKAAFLRELMQRRMSLATPYPEEVCLLTVDGVPFFAKGDVSALKSKQKQGKTTAICIMAAAILGGQWGRLKAVAEGQKVLLIDTEQKPQDGQQIYRRVLQLAGLPEEDRFGQFQMFTFRTLDAAQMLEGIRLLIRQEQPDIVFIDGIVDFISNFNEVEASQQVIKELMLMSSADFSGKDIAVVAVLHTNKAMEDNNMRGHAGTMLAQKAGIVLQCTKLDDVFTVRCSDSRHAPVPEWSFQYDREGRVVDADQLRQQRMEAERDIRRQMAEQRRQEVKDEKTEKLLAIIKRAGGRILRNELRDKYMKAMKVKKTAANSLIKKLNGTLIFESGRFITTERPLDGQLSFEQSDD